MKHKRCVPLCAFAVSVAIALGAAVAGTTHGLRPPLVPGPLCPPASWSALPEAAQDASAVEASLCLDAPMRRLIQRGLRQAGFDPGTATGLFNGRTRAAIKRWQEAWGRSPTGYVDAQQAKLLLAVGALQHQSFGYFMVMPSMMAALAVNQLLTGTALLVRRRRDVKGSFLHPLWALLLFALLVQYWHTTSMCAQTGVGDNLLEYALFLVFPAMIYLAYSVLMPHDIKPDTKFELAEHYYEHAMLFFRICSLGMVLEVLWSNVLQCGDTGNIIGENWFRLAGSSTALILVFANTVAGSNVCARRTIHSVVTVYAVVLFVLFVRLFRW